MRFITLGLLIFSASPALSMNQDCAAWLNSTSVGASLTVSAEGVIEPRQGFSVESNTERSLFLRHRQGGLIPVTLNTVYIEREKGKIKSIATTYKNDNKETIYLKDNGKTCFPKSQVRELDVNGEKIRQLDWDTDMCNEIKKYMDEHPQIKTCGDSKTLGELKNILDRYKTQSIGIKRFAEVSPASRGDGNPIAASLAYWQVCDEVVYRKFGANLAAPAPAKGKGISK